jgi:hypothetical protein
MKIAFTIEIRADVVKEARRRSRDGIGMPPRTRSIKDKRDKPVKHRKSRHGGDDYEL